ncbi:glycosyltransferase [Solwaraspora sp. WMMB335]|uniref:glycosyltransferase n=1 Tax=Solwaraspora sp. WMMB335 TaxID=3404118 RepID=UPI003B954EF4
MTRGAGTDATSPASTSLTWRLTGLARPGPVERLDRAVGLRVLWLPGTARVWVLAGTVDRLRDLAHHPDADRPVRAATVVVAWWRYPRPGWSGAVGTLRKLRRQRVGLPRLRRGSATVRLGLTAPAPLRDVVRAALRALDGDHPMPAPASPAVTAEGNIPAYLPATAAVVGTGGRLPVRDDIRAHDLLLAGPGAADPVAAGPGAAGPGAAGPGAAGPGAADRRDEAADAPYGTRLVGTGHVLHPTAGAPVVLIDAGRVNPRGRHMSAYRPEAAEVTLEFARGDRAGRARRTTATTGPTRHGSLTGPGLDATTLAALRRVRAVHCRLVPGEHPAQTAGLLVQLAATGVLLHAPVLPPAVRDLLDPQLRDLIAAPPPQPDLVATAALATEARSVRQRRAALRGHAAGLRLPEFAAGDVAALRRPPSVSAMLVTRRPESVATALAAITAQTYPEMEIILGLHGIDLPEPARLALSECGRPFEVVHLPGSADFGAALGAATRRARGTLVTKFDDDDSYGPEHVWDLVLARHYSGATLVGKGAEFVYLENQQVTLRRRSGVAEAYGDLVAGGTMLLAKGDLEAVGGWRPVPRSVDLGLIERLRSEGATIYRTHPLGYVYHRRPTGHTWDPGEKYFVDSAYARWPGVPADALDDLTPPSTAVASDAAGAATRPTGHRSS